MFYLLKKPSLHKYQCALLLMGALFGCENSGKEVTAAQTPPVRLAAETAPSVRTIAARLQDFPLQILSNGRLNATRQSNLQFKAVGFIESIAVANGTAVRAGQLIARLGNQAQRIGVRQAENQLDEARINVSDHLVRAGGKAGDSVSVRPPVWQLIKIESGYNKAVIGLQEARLKLEDTYLKAPYAGIIANLQSKPYNPVATDKPFCTLLGADAFAIGFSVLESELPAVRIGQPAKIMPVALEGKTYAGRVSEINPFVNEQGLVQVKVQLANPDRNLLEGMNARVVVERSLPGQVVVPKEAVVERSGRKVVFTYEKGLAKWHYVTVAHENGTGVAISEGLKPGEQVIVEGNLNLGHDAQVRLEK